MLTGRTLGDFTVRERIGEGGYGVVYRAEQRLLGREAVIKVLHTRHHTAEALIQRFNREAQLASRLDHPYAAHIYAFGAEPDGLLWIAMELVRGTPLSKLLAAQTMSVTRFVPLLDRLCEVVHTAHEQGIVHRDLKPDNVMVLARAGRLLPKLLDLGIAKLVAEPTPGALVELAPIGDADVHADTLVTPTAGTVALTQRGAHMGSPFYMAPEQWTDAAEVDARTDLYALGVLTYEALCGRVPFAGTTIAEVARAHLRGEMPALPAELPAALEPVLRRALARSREDRFENALAFAAAVRAAAGMRMAADALPRLDDALRDEIAWAPQPIAEAVGAVEAARNPHQARDAMWEVVHVAARYLGILALACRSRAGAGADGTDAPGVTSMLRELHRRDLADQEWLDLVGALTRPFAHAREAYPIPELVDLAAAEPSPFAPLLALRAGEGATTSEESLRDRLARTLPLLAPLLRALSFLTDYQLVVPRGPSAEIWMGARKPRRPQIAVGDGLRDGEPAIVDLDGTPVLHLAPLVQIAAPSPGAAEELFLFAGPSRARGRGARLVAEPAGFERQDDAVWDWFRASLLPVDDTTAAPTEETPYRGLHAFTERDAAMFFGRERQTEAFLNQLLVQPLLAVVGPSGAGKSSFVQAGVIPSLPDGWHAVTLRPGATPMAALADHLEVAAFETRVVVVDQFEELFTLCLDPDERVRFADALVRAAGDRVKVVLTLRDDFLIRAGELAPLHDRLARGLTLLATPAPEDLLRILIEPARRAGYDVDDPELPARMVRSVAGQPGALALLSFTASRLWELRDRHFKRLTRKAYDAIGGVEGALAGHAEDTLASCSPDERRLVREAFRHLVTAEGTRAVLTRAELDDVLGKRSPVIERLIDARLLVTTEGPDGAETIEVIHEALLSAWPRLVEWRRDDADGARLRDQLRAAARQWHDRGRARGLLWRDDALDDYRRWRARWPGTLPELDEAFAAASLRDARRGRTIRRALAATALTVLLAGVVSLSLLYRSSQQNADRATANAAQSRRTLLDSYIEQGRRYLLDGEYLKALPYLSAAYADGVRSTQLRFLLARAMRWAGAEISGHRHDAPAADAAFRNEGREVLSVDQHGNAGIWDATSGVILATLRGAPADGTVYPSVSTDGSFAVIPRPDRVILWDGAVVRELPVAGVEQVAIDPTHRIIALATADRVSAWDARSLAPLWSQSVPSPTFRIFVGSDRAVVRGTDRRARIVGPDARVELPTRGDVRTVAMSSDGSVATIGDSEIVVWTDQGRRRWSADASTLLSFATFSHDGGRLATVADTGLIQIYDVQTGHAVADLQGRTDPARLQFSEDGTRIAAAGDDLVLTVWDIASRRERVSLSGPAAAVTSLLFDPSGERIVSTWLDGGVRVFSTHEPDVARRITSPFELVVGDLAGDDRTLVAGSEQQLALWDARTGELRRTLDVAIVGAPHLSADGTQIVIPVADAGVEIRDLRSDERVRIQANATVNWAELDPAGTRVVTASLREVDVWNVDGSHLAAMRGHTHEVVSAEFSRDGKRVVTASFDKTVRLWDAVTGLELARLQHPDEVMRARFDDTGRLVVTGCADNLARIWDAKTGDLVRDYEHGSLVTGAALSPGGELLVGASQSGSVQVWDVEKGTTLAVFPHLSYASNVEFLHTGDTVVSTSTDHTAVFWNVATELPPSRTVTAFVACHGAFDLVDTRLVRRSRGTGCDLNRP